jgi:hypothetical protein
MAVLTTYPVLNVSETYLRQSLYDSLPAAAREAIDFESFRQYVEPEDYRFFAAALADLINDYVNQNNLFAEFIGAAAVETISRSEKLSRLYVPPPVDLPTEMEEK